MNKTSKIYIAGHQGMVGSALLRNLQEKGYSNFILRSKDELDLVNQERTLAFIGQEAPEIIFLAAARVGGIIANNTYRAQFIYENLMIQSNIIHSAYLTGVKKLLFLGSSCIYPRMAPQPLKEEYMLTSELESTNEPYAIAKIAGIKMCESYFRQYGCDFISVMPTNLYGPNDNFDLEKSHVLPALIRKFHLGSCLERADWKALRKDLRIRPIEGVDANAAEPEVIAVMKNYGIKLENGQVSITLWGSGKPLREFMHADDMASACIHVMENVSAHKLYHDLGASHINIGVGEDLSISALAEMVREITGFKGQVMYDHSKPDGTPRKLLDTGLLNRLGFRAQIKLPHGIRMVYKNYVECQ